MHHNSGPFSDAVWDAKVEAAGVDRMVSVLFIVLKEEYVIGIGRDKKEGWILSQTGLDLVTTEDRTPLFALVKDVGPNMEATASITFTAPPHVIYPLFGLSGFDRSGCRRADGRWICGLVEENCASATADSLEKSAAGYGDGSRAP